MTRATLAWMVVSALALIGCGDDDGATTADGGVDSGEPPMADGSMDAGTVPDAAAADGSPLDSGTDAGAVGCALDRLLITTSDFTNGAVGVLDIATGDVETDDVLDDQDSVPAVLGCTPVTLERGRGTMLVQSTEDLFTTLRTIELDPAGTTDAYATNPQMAVSVDDAKAYVVSMARNELLIVDPTADGTAAVTGTVDLSGFVDPDDADGLVDATDAIRVGDLVYVALGNYWFDESFAIQFEGSVLAVVDATTDTLVDVDAATDGVQGIALAGNNPWRGLWANEAGDRLWVGASGDSFALDGMIEEIDLDAQESLGAVVDEATVGAEINGFAVVSPNRVLLLAGSDVIAFDPGAAFPSAPTPIATGMDGMLLHGGALFAWARGGESPGMRRFVAASGTETTPGSTPWTFGTLPIYGVSPAP